MKKKKKYIIFFAIFLLIGVLAFFSKDMFHLLKGNVYQASKTTTITADAIKNMDKGTTLIELKDDNGFVPFDGKVGTYVKDNTFNDDKYASLSLDEKTLNSNLYTVNIVSKFHQGTAKKIRVTLNEGISYRSDDSVTLGSDLINVSKQFPSIKVKLSTNKDNALASGNGTITYELAEGIEIASINMIISPDEKLDYSSIADAIVVELIENDKVIYSSNIDVKEDFSKQPILSDTGTSTLYIGSESSYNKEARLAGFTTYSKNNRYILYDYVEIDVVAPSIFKPVLTGDNNDETLVGGGATSSYFGVMKLVNQKTNDDDTTTYTFRTENLYAPTFGLNLPWKIEQNDLNNISEGTEYYVKATSIRYQTRGKNKVNLPLNTGDSDAKYNRKFKFIVSKTENTILNIYESTPDKDNTKVSYTINSYDINHPTDDVSLGYYSLENASGVTSTSKDIIIDFPDYVDVKSINLIFPLDVKRDSKSVNVCYKLSNNNWNCKTVNDLTVTTASWGYDSSIITIKDLGLTGNEHITSFKYTIGTLPNNFKVSGSVAQWSQIYTGVITTLPKNEENLKAIETTYRLCETNEDCDYDISTKRKAVTNGIINYTDKKYNTNVRSFNGKKAFSNDTNKEVVAGDNIDFGYYIYPNNSMGAQNYMNFYNPIIYIRDDTNASVSNISLKTNIDGKELIDNCIITEWAAKDGAHIIKIDTSKLLPKDGLVGFVGNIRTASNIRYLLLSYTLTHPETYSDNKKIHYYKDNVFVTDETATLNITYPAAYSDGDPYDVDNDDVTDGEIMHYSNSSYYYRITGRVDLNTDLSYVQCKDNTCDTSYQHWSTVENNAIVSLNKSIKFKFNIQNNSGVDVKSADIYIPVPKNGSNFKELTNNETLKLGTYLKQRIDNPDNSTYKIYYGIIPNINNIQELYSNTSWIYEDDVTNEQIKNCNMIKIVVTNMSNNKNTNLYYELMLEDNTLKNIYQNQFKYVYYRDLTNKDNMVRTGYVYGNTIGMSNELFIYTLKVVYKDINNKELLIDKTNVNYGINYSTDEKEFDGYELVLSPSNKDGVIENDQTVTYVYRSVKARKVTVHYYEKDTKNKLLEDYVIEGKVLDAYGVEPKKIEGYDPVDPKIIRGNFSNEDEEIIFEYEKKTIINEVINNIPKTSDNIYIYLTLFYISIFGIIIVYKAKRTNN